MYTNYLFIFAPLMYAFSIYVDMFTYHLKFNLNDEKNYRYLFSLINVFQYSSRAFVLIFAPIMAYYTETIRDKNLIWQMTLLCHILVIFLIIPLYNTNYSKKLSFFLIRKLNLILGKLEYKKNFSVDINPMQRKKTRIETKGDVAFILFSFIAFLIFSFSMTFLYYIAFYYPNKVLILSSYSQLLNAFGAMSILLFIDPRIMAAMDRGDGVKELNFLTTSRIMAHFVLIIILLFII
ncbi:conserved membrane hypothetical protein [Capnocytophaga canimorsus]|uniref:Uncharacterized protein n=2 Tax=Capnocytophaga canimorsus TaxID=28188 RepID=A0A0B7HN59_9FLAO|nr:hypothetical protein CLV61_0155 [Capnocytophaga canimorsus]CEN39362.1 conserved membrane hypothetical protein [Capnocytophaga canimorsus]STA72521.1 Uncharacterised protein [Capnocytophaga canimorsus]